MAIVAEMEKYGSTAHPPAELADIRRDEIVQSLRAEIRSGRRDPMNEDDLVQLGTHMATDGSIPVYRRLARHLKALQECEDPVALVRSVL